MSKKAKWPDEIKIGPIRYKVIYCDNVQNVSTTGHSVVNGEIDFEKGIIRLYKHDCLDQMRKVLLHEIAHGFLHHIDRENNIVNDSEEERFCDLLAYLMLETFREMDSDWIKGPSHE